MGGKVNKEREKEEEPLRRQSWTVAGDMPLAPKPPQYLQLREIRLLLPSPPGRPLPVSDPETCDSGSRKRFPGESGWGQGPHWACSGLEGQQRHLWVPRECPERRKQGEVPSSYAKEVSQGCSEGGT